ncbi:hypothetical protein TKK_0011531 [Trichogramma kaykai]
MSDTMGSNATKAQKRKVKRLKRQAETGYSYRNKGGKRHKYDLERVQRNIDSLLKDEKLQTYYYQHVYNCSQQKANAATREPAFRENDLFDPTDFQPHNTTQYESVDEFLMAERELSTFGWKMEKDHYLKSYIDESIQKKLDMEDIRNGKKLKDTHIEKFHAMIELQFSFVPQSPLYIQALMRNADFKGLHYDSVQYLIDHGLNFTKYHETKCKNCGSLEFLNKQAGVVTSEVLVLKMDIIVKKINIPFGKIDLFEVADPINDDIIIGNDSFRISSVIFHRGPDMSSGHYVTMIAQKHNGVYGWWEINDKKLLEVFSEPAPDSNSTLEIDTTSPFILNSNIHDTFDEQDDSAMDDLLSLFHQINTEDNYDDEDDDYRDDSDDDSKVVEKFNEDSPYFKFSEKFHFWCIKYIHTITRYHMSLSMNYFDYIDQNLKSHFQSFTENYEKSGVITNEVQIMISIDGAPLAKSSEKGLWIISCSETQLDLVNLVGLYYGEEKPVNSNDLNKMFVSEFQILSKDGFLSLSGKRYNVKFHALICDTPAKAYVLNVKYHSGFYSCSKCKIAGTHENYVYFSGRPGKLRTDEDFRNMRYNEPNDYQKEKTIFNDIPNFGGVTQVPLDYMHLVCLGVVLKLIELWIKGPLHVRISNHSRQTISNDLKKLKSYTPSDFGRKPRKFENVRRVWKAHELRQFLLYTGPIVLRDNLPPDLYNNFLKLHVRITILINPILVENDKYLDFAENVLIKFVEDYEENYDPQNVVFNVHNILHLVADVRKYEKLDNFSAFRFENYIRKIKHLVRTGDNPLAQIARRLSEKSWLESKICDTTIIDKFTVENKHYDGPILPHFCENQFKKLKTKLFSLNVDDKRENCIVKQDGTVFECLNFINKKNQIFIIGKNFKTKGNLYEKPLSSSNLGIFKISNEPDTRLEMIATSMIAAKVCRYPYKGETFALSLHHSFG